MAKDLEYYLAQARRIEAHRDAGVEQEIRNIYKSTLADLRNTLADAYDKWGTDDQLSFADLQRAGYQARFLSEIQEKVNVASQMQAMRTRAAVRDAYELAYKSMVDGVEKVAQGKLTLDKAFKSYVAITPQQIKAAVNNPVAGLTLSDRLEKNRKDIIYNIKQTVGVGLMNGDRYTTMAKRVSDVLDGDYNKAIRIVRTEAHRVREEGRVDAADGVDEALQNGSSGMRMVKTWKSMKDERVRPQQRRKTSKGWVTTYSKGGANHMKMDGQVVLQDELFDLGHGVTATAPGQSGDAGNDINCRCYVSYEMMTDEEYYAKTGKHFPITPEKKALQEEKQYLQETATYTQECDTIGDEMAQLEGVTYNNIWKNPVTVKDYDTLKDRLPAKLDYFEANGRQDMIDLCNKFEENGKKYLALKQQYDAAEKKLQEAATKLKEARKKLMAAKGIDPDKIQAEIKDLESKLATLKQGTKAKLYTNKKVKNFNQDDLKEAFKSVKNYYGDDTIEYVLNNHAEETLSQFMLDELYWDEEIEKFKNHLKATLTNPPDSKAVEAMEKLLKDKRDEYEAIAKRYGLEIADDKFSQERKDAAYWFKDKKKADAVLRPATSTLWKGASQAEKSAAYKYTAGSGSFNRPLRGYDGSWSNFKGVGKVDLNNEGSGSAIKALTEMIDRNPSEFDIWLQRGVESSSGAASFFQISEKLLNSSEEELRKLLLGKVVPDDAFTSTAGAKGGGFSGRLILNIYAPKGTKFVYAEPFSAYGHGDKMHWDGDSKQSSFGYEFEVLLQRGTQFKITKIEKSGYTIYADVDIVGQP